jgi:hypothetical protein
MAMGHHAFYVHTPGGTGVMFNDGCIDEYSH